LLSLLWSGDPDDFRVTRPVASMTVCAQEEDDIQEHLSMSDLISKISNNIGIIQIVTVLRLTDRLGEELSKDGRAGHAAGSRS